MKKALKVILILFALISIAFFMGVCGTFFKISGKLGEKLGGGDVAIVDVKGTIVLADDIVENLEDVRKDDSVKAVVLRVDSPGGSVGASQEIFEEVKKVDAEKPVVASMGDVAASGGYYIAIGARRIFANPGTITGSIGVRMEHMNFGDLLKWAKLEHQTLKSGEMKDIGAFDRPLSPKEKEFLEGVLKGMHKQFKTAVAEMRKISVEEIEKIADGRIYTGEEALSLKLIDEIGGMVPAVKKAGELASIKGEPKVKKVKEETFWWLKSLLKESIKAGQMLAMYEL